MRPKEPAAAVEMDLSEEEEIVVLVSQDTRARSQSNLVRLLLYFTDPEFQRFPEMLQ